MKYRPSFLFVMPLIALVMMGCQFTGVNVNINRKIVRGEGNVVRQERTVSDFDALSLSGIGEVVITQGDEEGLTIEGEENLLEYITTEVKGSTLEIGTQPNVNIVPTRDLRFELRVKSLNNISVSGVSNITADALSGEKLEMSVSGAGNVDIDDLALTTLVVRSSGTGSFTLRGQADTQDITISGAGNYSAGDLQTRQTTIKVSGAGNGTVWASETLDVVISGLGKVEYYGSPSVQKDISGAGSVESRGDK